MANILTVPELRKAIKESSAVYADVRFGVCERFVKISKQEAMALVETIGDDSTTPEDFEMGTGMFGTWEGKGTELYLG